jgi:NAD(P)-dependent dehydrogenase (short-subunit alcohol dehydrogenase family)
MSKRFILAGASSAMSLATAEKLRATRNEVIGISRSEITEGYDSTYMVENYHQGSYPTLEGKFNGLVYFPGTINLKPFGRLASKDFQQDFDIHVMGAISFIQSFLPLLEKDGKSSIVLISSVAATTGMPFHASVSVAKSALEGLTRSLSAELAPHIRINAIAPSLVNTPMGAKFINTPEKAEAIQKRNPLQKIGSTEHIASAISFLLSDESEWITGQTIAVDGGMGKIKI